MLFHPRNCETSVRLQSRGAARAEGVTLPQTAGACAFSRTVRPSPNAWRLHGWPTRSVLSAGSSAYSPHEEGGRGSWRSTRLVLLAGSSAYSPREAASSFVNPLTVLGMLSTALEEGHSALVHTAAASQLGQMMVRVCMADEIPLVNVVRRPEQEELLRSINPDAIIVSQASPSFEAVRSKLQFEHQQQRLHSLLVADLFINDTNKDF